MKKEKLQVYRYARSEHIKWMGPYVSELAAWRALTGLDGLPAPGGSVWCTTEKIK